MTTRPACSPITGLAVGEFHIEVLIEPEIYDGKVAGCANRLMTRRVLIGAKETADTIHGRCPHAVRPGEYPVRSGPLLIEVRNPTDRASRNLSRFASRPPIEVAIREAMPPIVLKLKVK